MNSLSPQSRPPRPQRLPCPLPAPRPRPTAPTASLPVLIPSCYGANSSISPARTGAYIGFYSTMLATHTSPACAHACDITCNMHRLEDSTTAPSTLSTHTMLDGHGGGAVVSHANCRLLPYTLPPSSATSSAQWPAMSTARAAERGPWTRRHPSPLPAPAGRARLQLL